MLIPHRPSPARLRFAFALMVISVFVFAGWRVGARESGWRWLTQSVPAKTSQPSVAPARPSAAQGWRAGLRLTDLFGRGRATELTNAPFAAGEALNFDGVNDFVSIPHSGNLPLTSPFTVETWIYVQPTSELFPTVFSKNSDNLVMWLQENSASAWRLCARIGGTQLTSPTVNISENTWTHVALTYDGTTGTLYKNGNAEVSGAVTGPSSNTSPFLIGYWESNGRPFHGSIDEFRIWASARTQAEIQTFKDSEIASMPNCLIAYYKFNQGTADGANTGVTTLTDTANNTLENGTLNNFALSGTGSNWTTGAGITQTASAYVTNIPDINLKGNGNSIADGTTATGTTNNTDFGTAAVGVGLSKSFTIENTGTGQLTVSAISFTGTNASEYAVSGITLPATIAASGSTTFSVTLTPTSAGTRTATINVVNDDCDESNYDFALTGAGTVPIATTTIGFHTASGALGNYYNGGTDAAGNTGTNSGIAFNTGSAGNGVVSETVIVNVPNGFTTGFALSYLNVSVGFRFVVWDGLNGTGMQLVNRSFDLNGNGNGGATFSGIGKSVTIGKYSGGPTFDNLTFGASTIGTPIAEPPGITTSAATSVTDTTATINGLVNPGGATTTAQFEYGTTTSYGSTVSITLSPDNGTTGQSVSANLTGLTPSTMYHFRVTGSNSIGSRNGSDFTFTTSAPSTYTFTGSGNWSTAANWSGGFIPPATLPSGKNIIINGSGACVLDVTQILSSGAALTVNAGKR